MERLQALKLQHIQKFIDGLRYAKIIILSVMCLRKSDKFSLDYMCSVCVVLNIAVILVQFRTELYELWDKCFFGPVQREEFTPAFDGRFTLLIFCVKQIKAIQVIQLYSDRSLSV